MGWYEFTPYESVAEKKAKAERLVQNLTRKGRKLRPVRIQGKAIATTFWGKAWCANLERYSDYGNRLPRGRSYVRNCAVVHLEVENGRIVALVSGSRLYDVRIGLKPVEPARWQKIKSRCSGQIGSLIELLRGELSMAVMQVVTDQENGLFPKQKEIDLGCSCPDYAGMCKHIAAVLYAIGNRLDAEPEMLFALRGVDHHELITEALPGQDEFSAGSASEAIATHELSDIFGIDLEIDIVANEVSPPASSEPATKKRSAGKSHSKSISKSKADKSTPAVLRKAEITRVKSRRSDRPAESSREVSTGKNDSQSRSGSTAKSPASPKSPVKAKPNVFSKSGRKASMAASPKRSSVKSTQKPVPKAKPASKPDANANLAPKANPANGKRKATKSDRDHNPNQSVIPALASASTKQRAVASASRSGKGIRRTQSTSVALSPVSPGSKRRKPSPAPDS